MLRLSRGQPGFRFSWGWEHMKAESTKEIGISGHPERTRHPALPHPPQQRRCSSRHGATRIPGPGRCSTEAFPHRSGNSAPHPADVGAGLPGIVHGSSRKNSPESALSTARPVPPVKGPGLELGIFRHGGAGLRNFHLQRQVRRADTGNPGKLEKPPGQTLEFAWIGGANQNAPGVSEPAIGVRELIGLGVGFSVGVYGDAADFSAPSGGRSFPSVFPAAI